jgi:hypothetical protein
MGCNALFFNTTGSSNIALGVCSGCLITTGTNNTVIGSLSGSAGLVCTVLLGAGTCERIKVDNSGLCVNGTLLSTLINATDDNSTTTLYPVMVSAAGSEQTAKIDSSTTPFVYNASTGTLTVINLAATTKSFVIDHPTKPNMKLNYGSLEGPENGVYVRGKLEDSNIIELPEYWTKLVDTNSITVQLTSIGSPQNLYVEDIIDNKIIVGGLETKCFYIVHAERIDVDKLEVEINNGR